MINATEKAEQPNQEQTEQKQPEAWTRFAPASSIQSDEPSEVTEIRTELPLPARPFIKGGFALAFSGSVLVLIWIFFQMASGIGWNKEKQSTEEQDNQLVAKKPSSEMTSDEKLQWCMATRKCGDPSDPSKNAATTAKANHKPTFPSQNREQLAPPAPIQHQLSYNTAQEFSRPVQVQPVQPLVSPHPVVSTPLAPRPAPQPALPPQPAPDPIVLLAQASNLGTYTTGRDASPSPSPSLSPSSSPNPSLSLSPSSSPNPSPSPDSSPVSSGSSGLVADRRLANASEGSVLVSPHPEKVIPVTTRIKATVATTIAWISSKAEQKFRIQTESDMKAADGSIVVPKGSYLLAQVSQSNSTGYIDVQILSVQIDGQEKSIPPDAILVQGKGGEPIRARVKDKKGGVGLGRTFLAAGLAGIGEAASTANSAKIFVGNTTTVTSGSNVGALVAKGVADSLSQQISGQVNQPERYRTSDEPVLLLKEGTKLELFINQNLNL